MPDPEPQPNDRGDVGTDATDSDPKPRDGRLVALAILQTLAGEKSPTEAAEGLGVSLTYYYTLESKALEGLVRACEPKPKGRQLTLDRKLEEAEKESARLRRELRRSQAVARAAQRALEIAPATPAPRASKKTTKKKGKRKKRATVRALKAVDRLKAESDEKIER